MAAALRTVVSDGDGCHVPCRITGEPGSSTAGSALARRVTLSRSVPLSVLDLAPVVSGSTATEALRHTLDLARLAERLGYHRYWVAEHHNMPGIASSAPAVLIGQVAAHTTTMRVGSGGVMLPNHPPLVVAEQFGMLTAMHPGRIDLGIGRAPGTDQRTAAALRRTSNPLSVEDFPRQLAELISYFDPASGDPAWDVTAVPAPGNKPPVWLLGSSDFSATAAGMMGLPFSFAHHFSAQNTMPALAAYRRNFRPSADLDKPYAMVAVGVVVAETEEHARWLAGSQGLSMVRLRSGRPGLLPSPQEAADYPYTDAELAVVESWGASHIVGTPSSVREQLNELLERTEADELMVTSMIHGHQDRLRSYELLAEVGGLNPAGS
ncbi:luciferase family oxidoreductase, group 1 [Actinoalloteichus hymeniacidonis]|uniref:Luciferase family oxidoreductase, group 1 n=1 Tax=Actinoalloteichus hymeniacidonis TaxID=340345 RepID=A0AAC9MY58_9PSEU|nr:luciferase family oxidoreductase, group 1 [Actinoalloteichus hymeniacidonis]